MVINVEIINDRIVQVKDFALTSKALENKLRTFRYDGEGQIKDQTVERMKLPPIALVFYSYLYENEDVLSDIDLVYEYFKQPYFRYVEDGKVEVDYAGAITVVSIEAVSARVLRTYPSLVRDLHFYLLARESGLFSEVRYSFRKDFYDKIDLRVKHEDNWHNIGLMLGSKRSLAYKEQKVYRHNPVDTVDIELHTNDAVRVGDFLLYSKKHIYDLIQRIESK